MHAKKIKQIETAIQTLMRENKLGSAISNGAIGALSNQKEYEKCFIYVEIVSTYPEMTYVFNSETPISIGRGVEGNTICIQDMEVSRKHCELYVENGYLYLHCYNVPNQIVIKRGLHRVIVGANQCEPVFHKDLIQIGQTIMKVYLIFGTSMVIN